MTKLILILLSIICLVATQYKRSTSPNLTQLHLTYIQDTIEQKNKATIYIEYRRLSHHVLGITKPLSDSEYLILISPHYQAQEHTIMHELVHVKQMHLGQLNRKNGQWYWYDQPADPKQPYTERPWEQRAELEAIFYELIYKQ